MGPSMKYGDTSDLQDYKGGRSFDDLKKHAETLGPTCGPANLDLCDEDKKKTIAEFTALGAEKREAMIKEKKEEDVEAVKNSGLGLLKAVNAHEKKAKSEL